MALVPSGLTLVEDGTHYGEVTVYTDATLQTIERRYKVTKKQYDDFHASCYKNPGDPTLIGCTPQEWHAPPLGEGRAVLSGKCVDVGQAVLRKDGTILALYQADDTRQAKRRDERHVKLTLPDYEIVDGVLMVSEKAKRILDGLEVPEVLAGLERSK